MKPLDAIESYWFGEFKWSKGRVNKKFHDKYGWREAKPKTCKMMKRETRRARRRNLKKLLEDEIQNS